MADENEAFELALTEAIRRIREKNTRRYIFICPKCGERAKAVEVSPQKTTVTTQERAGE